MIYVGDQRGSARRPISLHDESSRAEIPWGGSDPWR